MNIEIAFLSGLWLISNISFLYEIYYHGKIRIQLSVYKELQYINDVRLLLCDRDYLITENMLYIANYNEDIKLSNFKRFIIWPIIRSQRKPPQL